uniref:Uncharacterized protein n=1 Tax=Anguilla anguilla TaxID=7936 RepID=A0A0E9UQ04_ANGAN
MSADSVWMNESMLHVWGLTSTSES